MNVNEFLDNNEQNDLSPIEVSSQILPNEVKKLAPILETAQNLQNATEATAPTILSEISSGLISISRLLSSARYHADLAKIEKKKVQGMLALEAFPKYCSETGVKVTEGNKEAFIDCNQTYTDACKTEAYLDALVTQLDVIKTTFIQSISSVKAIVYGFKDSNIVSGNRIG